MHFAGLSCLYGTLSVEGSRGSGEYDVLVRQMLQIPILGVNDAPEVSGAWVAASVNFCDRGNPPCEEVFPVCSGKPHAGPIDWSIKAGTVTRLQCPAAPLVRDSRRRVVQGGPCRSCMSMISEAVPLAAMGIRLFDRDAAEGLLQKAHFTVLIDPKTS